MSDTKQPIVTAAAPATPPSSTPTIPTKLKNLAPPFLHNRTISQLDCECKGGKLSHFAWLTDNATVFIESFDPNLPSPYGFAQCECCVAKIAAHVLEILKTPVEITDSIGRLYIPEGAEFKKTEYVSMTRNQDAPLITYYYRIGKEARMEACNFNTAEMKWMRSRELSRVEKLQFDGKSAILAQKTAPRMAQPMAQPMAQWVGPPQYAYQNCIPAPNEIDLSDRVINWLLTTHQIDTIRSVMDNLNLLDLTPEQKSDYVKNVATDLIAKNLPSSPNYTVLSVKIPEAVGTGIAVTALMECAATLNPMASDYDKFSKAKDVALKMVQDEEHRYAARAGEVGQGEYTEEMFKKVA